MKKFLKKYWNAIFLVVVFAFTLWTVFKDEDLGEMFRFLTTANPIYSLLSILCVLGFICSESVIIQGLLRTLGHRVRLSRCCLYSFIGFFYSCITPSASGGQPMQIIAMRKDGIPGAVSTVVLAIVTIAYKLVLVFIGLIVMIIRPEPIMVCLDSTEPIIYLGLVLNVVCIAALLLLVFHPKLVRSITNWCLKLINRIRPFRNPDKLTARVDRTLSQYEGTAEYFIQHKRVVVRVFAVTLVQRFLLFFITWLTYLSFGLSGDSMERVVLLQAMISVAADMMPLPGGMGVSENLFLIIFDPVFGEELVLSAMVISRGISYYTQLLISAVMTVVAAFVIKDPSKRKVEETT